MTILAVAATEMEMLSLARNAPEGVRLELLVTGVGPMETAHVLTRHLAEAGNTVGLVLNFGVAGAYVHPDGSGAEILDLCLAGEEVLGDLGICRRDRIEPLQTPELGVRDRFTLDPDLLRQAQAFFRRRNMTCHTGRFVTVNCVSGTLRRGGMLAASHQALCENMEGAAVARVCEGFAIPCLELRCISNLVEDRDTGTWRLKEACQRAGRAAALLAAHLGRSRS